jgi:chorismate-pyruvate lyase
MPSAQRVFALREAGRVLPSTHGILFPLDLLYAQAGVPSPSAKLTEPDRIPSPYDSLLVHEAEMTRTLERHFGGQLAVRALSASVKGHWYMRRVLLAQEYSGRPVAMGAVRIRLDRFAPRIRARILSQQTPLGRILREGRVAFRSRPTRFLEITPNAEMMGVFWMREPQILYGRQTKMTLEGVSIGDVVEVLALV